jgi:hypothetical protein
MMRYHSPKEYLVEAQSTETSAQRLDILAETQWEFVRAAVAANPNTSVRTLVRLLPVGVNPLDQPIAVAIAKRADAPEVLRKLMERFGRIVNWAGRSMNSDLGFALAANPATPADVIDQLLDPRRSTTHFRVTLARTSPRVDLLHRLRNDVSEKVRQAVERRLESMKDGV